MNFVKSGINQFCAIMVQIGWKYCKTDKIHHQTKYGYPNTVINFNIERGLHPTQKPVALMEYLIKTYTNENEIVLDFTMGSGTTGVACINTNRNFIGIELDEGYFKIAQDRISTAGKEGAE